MTDPLQHAAQLQAADALVGDPNAFATKPRDVEPWERVVDWVCRIALVVIVAVFTYFRWSL